MAPPAGWWCSYPCFVWACGLRSLGWVALNGTAGSDVSPLEELPDCLPAWLHHFAFPSTVFEGSSDCTSSTIPVVVCLSDSGRPRG